MRILFCNYEYPPLGGGGGVINALLAEEMARDHEVTVLTSQGLETPERELVNGVDVRRVPVFFRSQLATANLASMAAYMIKGRADGPAMLADRSFDVINTHFALPSGPVGTSLARRWNVPHVLTLLGGDVYDPSKALSPHRHAVLRRWVSRMARAADRVLADSTDVQERFNQFFDPTLKVDVIPLGIRRPPDVVPCNRGDFGLADDDIVLTTVGRLVRRKAVDQLIDCVAASGNSKLKLLLVGTGPLEGELRNHAVTRGIGDQVVFAGFVPEETKLGLLRSADVFVSASQHEGFGLVFLEAMAAGLPVICYNMGGQTDFLADGRTGYLVPLNDRETFSRRVRELAGDAGIRARMREHNLAAAESYYIDVCARRYIEVFESVTTDRAPAETATRQSDPVG